MNGDHSGYPGALVGPDGEIYFRRADTPNVTADQEHDAERGDAATDLEDTPQPASTHQLDGKEVQ
jgi:hypothetical protein